MIEIYKQIVELQTNSSISKQSKGYLFEQLIREIQPWDFRPPIVITGLAEQLDGVYNWDGKTFIIECKAKEKLIKRGESDWEDFELKIRKRKGSVIGLFCSLHSVHQSILEAASDMNKEGLTTLILSDQFWVNLNTEKVEFKVILPYLITYARASFKPSENDIAKIKEWYYSNTNTLQKINSILIGESSTFFRRFKKENHSKLYVKREIDKSIYEFARQLKPSALKVKYKTRGIKGTDYTYEQKKELPLQLFMLRDFSGAGKTFFSTQYADNRDSFLAYTKAANQKDIDNVPEVLNKIGGDFGIQELIALDKPILYFIDSLDEAIYTQNAHVEVRAAIDFLYGKLNSVAQKFDLSVFPFALVFTIREDYWRHWESDFEGRRTSINKKIISSFNELEFKQALENYSCVYNFRIKGRLDNNSKKVLSVPINLAIFSETNEYKGDIEVEEVWEENILYSYFSRKRENVTKRNITGITQDIFIKICSYIAYNVIKKKSNQIHKKEIALLIKLNFGLLQSLFEEIILLLESESILISSSEDRFLFGFKHNRFIEFLCSYYALQLLDREHNPEILDSFSDLVFESGLASMFKVHDFIIYISKREFPELATQIDYHYANSEKIMRRSLQRLRCDIAAGDASGERYINLILKKCTSKDPEITWSSFFVIVAKQNNPVVDNILITFKNAWDSNLHRGEIWKLLPKMAVHNLLINQDVSVRVFASENLKVWEVFLGLILEFNLKEEFRSLWREVDSNHILKVTMSAEDWGYNKKILDIIINDKKYVRGEEF